MAFEGAMEKEQVGVKRDQRWGARADGLVTSLGHIVSFVPRTPREVRVQDMLVTQKGKRVGLGLPASTTCDVECWPRWPPGIWTVVIDEALAFRPF